MSAFHVVLSKIVALSAQWKPRPLLASEARERKRRTTAPHPPLSDSLIETV